MFATTKDDLEYKDYSHEMREKSEKTVAVLMRISPIENVSSPDGTTLDPGEWVYDQDEILAKVWIPSNGASIRWINRKSSASR